MVCAGRRSLKRAMVAGACAPYQVHALQDVGFGAINRRFRPGWRCRRSESARAAQAARGVAGDAGEGRNCRIAAPRRLATDSAVRGVALMSGSHAFTRRQLRQAGQEAAVKREEAMRHCVERVAVRLHEAQHVVGHRLHAIVDGEHGATLGGP